MRNRGRTICDTNGCRRVAQSRIAVHDLAPRDINTIPLNAGPAPRWQRLLCDPCERAIYDAAVQLVTAGGRSASSRPHKPEQAGAAPAPAPLPADWPPGAPLPGDPRYHRGFAVTDTGEGL